MAAGIGRLTDSAALGAERYALIGDGERNTGFSRQEQIRRIGCQRIGSCLHRCNPSVVFFLYTNKAVERAALVAITGVVKRQHYRRCLSWAERAVIRHLLNSHAGCRNVHSLERCSAERGGDVITVFRQRHTHNGPKRFVCNVHKTRIERPANGFPVFIDKRFIIGNRGD